MSVNRLIKSNRICATPAATAPSTIAIPLINTTRRDTSVDSRGMLAASSDAPSAGATGNASVLPVVRTLACSAFDARISSARAPAGSGRAGGGSCWIMWDAWATAAAAQHNARAASGQAADGHDRHSGRAQRDPESVSLLVMNRLTRAILGARAARRRSLPGLDPGAFAFADPQTQSGSAPATRERPRNDEVVRNCLPVGTHAADRRFLGKWCTRNSIWSARMLRLERIRCSTQLGL